MAYKEAWIGEGENGYWGSVYVPDEPAPTRDTSTSLLDTLPANWSTYGAADKISYFNANNVTPVELAAVGVSGADLAWMQNNGYSVKATPTEVLTTMKENNLSPEQMAQTIAAPVGEVVSTVAKALSPNETVNLGGTVIQPVYDIRGEGENVQQGPLQEVLVYNQNQVTGDPYKTFTATGEQTGGGTFKDVSSLGQMLKETGQELGPIALAALTGAGAGGMLGSSLGLTGTTANVVGGALLGGGGAAITGNDPLKGALLGGASSYLSSLINAGITDSALLESAAAADIAGGMVPEFGTNAAYDSFMQAAMTPAAQAAIEQMINQPYIDADMAGGLTPQYGSNSVYDSFMESAMTPEAKAAIEQMIAENAISDADIAGGMVPEYGSNYAYDSFMESAMTPEARAIIEQLIGDTSAYDADVAGGMVPEYGTNEAYDAFMQSAMTPDAMAAIEQMIANSSVAGMTPEQILQQGDMITNIASGNAMGPVTAEDLGKAFEEYMAQGGYTSTPETGALGSTVTAAPETTPTVETPAEVTTGAAASTLGGLTSSQIANLIKAGVSLASIAGAVKATQPSSTTPAGAGATTGALPTQVMPTYTPDYYQQLQQYYNAYMPQTPRDVVSPLQQWYNAKSGA